jgi:hypothetical protein
MIATMGGRCMALREREVVRRVHVHEQHVGIAESCHLACRKASDADFLVESHDATILVGQRLFDRAQA